MCQNVNNINCPKNDCHYTCDFHPSPEKFHVSFPLDELICIVLGVINRTTGYTHEKADKREDKANKAAIGYSENRITKIKTHL